MFNVHISFIRYITDKNELVFGKLLCLEGADNRSGIPILNKCHEMGGGQEWKPTDDVSINIIKCYIE